MIRPFRFQAPLLRRCLRYSSTSPLEEVAPLFTKIKSDLKAALKAKDKTRLDVLRAIISEVNNAAKTPKPVTTDLHLLDLLRKRSSLLEASGKEYSAAGREDLTTKADGERSIVDEYASLVKVLGDDEVREALRAVVAKLKDLGTVPAIGHIIKQATKAGGPLEGKPVAQRTIAKIAEELIGELK